MARRRRARKHGRHRARNARGQFCRRNPHPKRTKTLTLSRRRIVLRYPRLTSGRFTKHPRAKGRSLRVARRARRNPILQVVGAPARLFANPHPRGRQRKVKRRPRIVARGYWGSDLIEDREYRGGARHPRRALRSIARRPRARLRIRRRKNPIAPFISGAAAGLGMALGARLAGGALRNPRKRRNPRGRGGAVRGQRLSGTKILPWAEAARDPEVKRAIMGHKRFHASEPIHVTRTVVADGSRRVERRVGYVVGECPEVTYKPAWFQKSNKQGATWVHKMGEKGGKKPLWVFEPKTGIMSLVGGTYKLTDWIHN